MISASAAEENLNGTETKSLHVVTLEPVVEPTREHTAEPTREPTAEPTREPTREFTVLPTKEPVGPEVGWLSILSTPSEATVSIDGKPAGVTPIAGRELGAGPHTVKVSLSGYVPYETTTNLHAGEQASVDATLDPVPEPTKTPTKEPTATPTITTKPIGGDKGWITVSCNVNGATVSFDDLSSGCTVSGGSCSTEVTTTGTPFTTFTVQKPGYQIFTGPVTKWPAKGETVNLYATLNPDPSPTYGTIVVYSSPSGAVATLDGSTWQYTPATFTSVGAGTSHYLLVTMSGYEPYGVSVYVAAGQTSTVNAYLSPTPPQPSLGSLSLSTSPQGADIYIDSRYVAQSPSVIPGLTPGSHSLRLHKAGYDEYLSTFTITAGQRNPLSVSLSPQRPTVGSVEVASTPPGSSVYLDGTFMGQTPNGDFLDLTSILPGYHTLLVRQADYQDYTQQVSVKGGQVVTVNARLVPVTPGPVPDTTGQLVIASSPAGAEVLLDNVFKGITPVTLIDIPAGSHVLTLRESGYADATQTVMVTGGQDTPVSVSLAEKVPTTATPLTLVPVMGALLIGAFVIMRRR
jgi:hypothetical protein